MTDTLLGPLAELALRSVDDYAKKCGFSDEVLTLARRAAVIAAGEARDAAVAAERERCAQIVKLANIRSGYERTGARTIGRYDVSMISDIESGAAPRIDAAMAGARATAQTLIAAPVLFRHGLRRSDGCRRADFFGVGMTPADECRDLGLSVGDTIFGREEGPAGIYWHEARLTLLWLGRDVAVWSATERGSTHGQWSQPKETASWTLAGRPWRKVGP